jgi:protein-S-isoprenylcysteine O-methyltransferase Ste14
MPVIAIFTLHLLYHFAVFLAWAGGAAFVASLLYLVYFYVVTLGDPSGDPSARWANTAVNIALFSAFALHHSALARTGAKAWVTRVIPSRLERTAYVWTASLLTVLMCLAWQPVAGRVYTVEGWIRLPFWSIQALGVLLTVRAARAVSALELAGIRQAARRTGSSELKVVGPFRLVRHPIYLGWVLMVVATPAMTANRLLFAAISSLYLILAIPWEERSLVEGHGDRYRDYQQRVRWRLIPGLW